MKNMGFYIFSMFLAFMFAMFISVYSTIHYGDMVYMNLMLAFIIVVMTSFFIISAVYFYSEKEIPEGRISALFFIGMFLLAVYASKAVDATNMTKYGIFYTIIVSGICSYIILSKKLAKKKASGTVSIKDAVQDLVKMKKKFLQAKKTVKKNEAKKEKKPEKAVKKAQEKQAKIVSKKAVEKAAKREVKKAPGKAATKAPKKAVEKAPEKTEKKSKADEEDPDLKSVLNYLDKNVKK